MTKKPLTNEKKSNTSGPANANGAVDSIHAMRLAEKVHSLTLKLMTEESRLLALQEVRAVAMADLRRTYGQKVKLYKGFCIAILVILFQAALILRLIVN